MVLFFKQDDRTPKIKEVEMERYMRINSVVEFRGQIFTDSYGNANAADDSLDNDDQKISIVSLFVGPKECEMVGVLMTDGFFLSHLGLLRSQNIRPQRSFRALGENNGSLARFGIFTVG